MQTSHVQVKNILTRTSGYLHDVASHSLQPYRGCSFGKSLCGIGCYVQHNAWITAGRPWGSFLEIRDNAAESYARNYLAERAWARKQRSNFSIFLSSATDPFLPQERRAQVTRRLLETMCDLPPDLLILQTHSSFVTEYIPILKTLSAHSSLRVHISIETDREHLPGLPPHAASVEDRLAACQKLKQAGLFTVVTVAPLLPIADPATFFLKIADVADAVVIDHFIEGDGTPNGSRTARTPLPAAMESIHPGSSQLTYRDEITTLARSILPGRVGIGQSGFAGQYT